jgi:hypothetical protein
MIMQLIHFKFAFQSKLHYFFKLINTRGFIIGMSLVVVVVLTAQYFDDDDDDM